MPSKGYNSKYQGPEAEKSLFKPLEKNSRGQSIIANGKMMGDIVRERKGSE